MLGCVGIHRNLMDEERIAVRQRVERKFVAQLLAFRRGVYLRVRHAFIQAGQPQAAAEASDQGIPSFAPRAAHGKYPPWRSRPRLSRNCVVGGRWIKEEPVHHHTDAEMGDERPGSIGMAGTVPSTPRAATAR